MTYLVTITDPLALDVVSSSPIAFAVESTSLELDNEGNAQAYSTENDSLVSVMIRIGDSP